MKTLFLTFNFSLLTFSGINAQCNCAWMASQDTMGCGIIFNDLSTGNPNTWYWSFGDAQTSTLQNPYHNYPAPGTYNVCLIITNTSTLCVDTTCGNINVVCFPAGIPVPGVTLSIQPNFPDPFSDNTVIPYHLPSGMAGQIKIYDIHGKQISRIELNEGSNTVEVNGSSWESGYYFYAFEINGRTLQFNKMVLIR